MIGHGRTRRRHRCTVCRQTFSPRTGTMFHRRHTGMRLMVQFITLISYGCPIPAIEAAFGVLARLHGDDPATVIRRAYVRLLMRGAHAGQARAPQHMPAEYAHDLRPLFPTQQDVLESLTQRHEQARYHPEAVTASDAADAQAAWEQLESAAVPQTRGAAETDQ